MNKTENSKVASKTFVCTSFTSAIAFVQEIGQIAQTQDHHPDIDIRYREVSVRIAKHYGDEALIGKDERLLLAVEHASRLFVAQRIP